MPNPWTGVGNPYTRNEIIERLHATLKRGEPIIVAGAGCGISAKFIEKGGADMIIVYNSGRFRMNGHGSTAGLMAYGDSNAVVVNDNYIAPLATTTLPQFEGVLAPAHLSKTDAKSYVLGAEVFQRDGHCATCHQPDGKGMQGVYPPLVGTEWALGDEERLIKLTLHGLWGEIEINGVTYSPAQGLPPMTAFASTLTDEEVAGVLTYVRNSWDNQATPITAKIVKRVRAANTDRTIFWKPEELLNLHPLNK